VTSARPVLRLFLDEGVPDSVGEVFSAAGHQVAYLNRMMEARGSADQVVCVIADINNSILVALDGDMKRIAQGIGAGGRKYLQLGLIKLSCYEPDAARRVREAMSLIEHEWDYSAGKPGRRIFVEILDTVIRTVR
jgi:predicted nuclease of predicted toxin-antitoxin system